MKLKLDVHDIYNKGGEIDRALRAVIDEGKAFTQNIALADGRITAVVNQPMEGGGWVATHEDITERKRAEHELEQTRQFLDTILENVPTPIIATIAITTETFSRASLRSTEPNVKVFPARTGIRLPVRW